MFNGATSFNQPLVEWDVSAVTEMQNTFINAHSFNQSIDNWDVSSATKMSNIFLNNPSLSDAQKGKIHKSFSTNSNWPYDWAVYANAPPNFISLSDSNFSENLPIGSIIGTFSAIDPDKIYPKLFLE